MTQHEEQRAIGELLAGCVLSPEFTMNGLWVEGLKVNARGAEILGEMGKRSSDFGETEQLFGLYLLPEIQGLDVSSTPSSLVSTISSNIAAQDLLFPNNVGKELQEEVFRTLPETDGNLTYQQTLKLLRAVSPGVYHVGTFLSGPLGLIRVDHERFLSPRRDVPLGLCADEECFRMHPLTLETNDDALINRCLREMTRTITDLGYQRTDLERRVARSAPRVRENRALFDMLSDGFSVTELRSLVRRLYETGEKFSRVNFREAFEVDDKNLEEWAADFDKGSLLQCVLFHSNRSINSTIRDLVLEGEIQIEESEVRASPVQNRWTRHVPSQVLCEIAPFGIRYRNPDGSSRVARTLTQLIRELYFAEGVASREDLSFYLDASSETDEQVLIDQAVRVGTAQDVIEKVLLATSALRDRIGLLLDSPIRPSESRYEYAGRISWLLGANSSQPPNNLDKLRSRIEDFRAAVNAGFSDDDTRKIMGELSYLLEAVAQKALVYSTWAFAVDHAQEKRGFSFSSDIGVEVFEIINEGSQTQESYRLTPQRDLDAATLFAGFSQLANHLDKLHSIGQSGDTDPARGEHVHAEFLGGQIVQTLPKVLTPGPTFLSLNSASRTEIIASLRECSKIMGNKEVVGVRNYALHPKDSAAFDSRNVLAFLSAIEDWLEILVRFGFYPLMFTRSEGSSDELGRGAVTYRRGTDEVKFLTPRVRDMGRLPGLEDQLLILPKAIISSYGELCFSVQSYQFDVTWTDYPYRFPGIAG